MTTICFFIFVMVNTIVWSSETANADYLKPQQQQQQQPSQVSMSLDEFQDLFSSARLQEAEQRLLDQRKMYESEHRQKMEELEILSKHLSETESIRRRKEIFPENYQILQHDVAGIFNSSSSSICTEAAASTTTTTTTTGFFEGDVAIFHVQMTLRVVEPHWTIVPIMNTSSTVASQCSIAWKGDENDDGIFQSVDPVTSPDSMLLLSGEQQVLATNRSGLFRVSFHAYTRVSKTHNLNSLTLSSLLYPLSHFSLRIATNDEDNYREGGGGGGGSVGTITELSVQPPAAVLQLIPASGYTDINITLPLSTDRVEIRWLDVAISSGDTHSVDGEDDEGGEIMSGITKQKKKKALDQPQVTAIHEALHSVDEGIIRSSHGLEFQTSDGFLSEMELSIIGGEKIRVTSVSGLAVSSWTQTREGGNNTTVRVQFKTNLESNIQLQVHTEMDRDASNNNNSFDQQQIELPRIVCHNVLRQTGFIAVVKDANVEVHENNIAGLSRCDISEIPSQIRLNTAKPIVLSYKYLHPKHSILLDVFEHATLDVLEASVDRLHHKILVTDTVAVHSLIIIVQSAKLQYLELHGIPESASKFTAVVNSLPTKPVEGKVGGSILIPILVGNHDGGGSFLKSVEVTFVTSHPALSHGQNGTLHVSPVQLSIPISLVTVHLSLPESYDYSFLGNLASYSVERMEVAVPKAFSYETGRRVVQEDYKFSRLDDLPIWEDDEKSKIPEAVRIVTSSSGKSFYFQRILVIDDKLALNATYNKPKEKERPLWWFF